LNGLPTASGAYSFTVTSSDGATMTFSGSVAVPNLSPSAMPTMRVGFAMSAIVSSSGGGSETTYAVSAGSLPAGLSLTPGGSLDGTPINAGAYSFSITASDGATRSYSGTIQAGLSISPGSLPDAPLGEAYSLQLTVGGAAAWTIGDGGLPPGLTLNGSSGLISGMPTTLGAYPVTIVATVSGFSALRNFTLNVVPTPLHLAPPAGTTIFNAALNQPMTPVTITALGGTGPVTWEITGLPAGVTWSAGSSTVNGVPVSTATISGTPSQAFAGNVTISATDSSAPPQNVTQGYPAAVTLTGGNGGGSDAQPGSHVYGDWSRGTAAPDNWYSPQELDAQLYPCGSWSCSFIARPTPDHPAGAGGVGVWVQIHLGRNGFVFVGGFGVQQNDALPAYYVGGGPPEAYKDYKRIPASWLDTAIDRLVSLEAPAGSEAARGMASSNDCTDMDEVVARLRFISSCWKAAGPVDCRAIIPRCVGDNFDAGSNQGDGPGAPPVTIDFGSLTMQEKPGMYQAPTNSRFAELTWHEYDPDHQQDGDKYDRWKRWWNWFPQLEQKPLILTFTTGGSDVKFRPVNFTWRSDNASTYWGGAIFETVRATIRTVLSCVLVAAFSLQVFSRLRG
jgi:hypothetical protein